MALTLGVSAANTANKWLDVFGNTAFAGITTVYVQLHTGIPGEAGTLSVSTETDRMAITWSGAAASGSKSMTGTLSWTAWNAGSQTISHISLWDAASGGNFLWSGALSSSKAVSDGDTLNITALTIAIATASIAAT